MSGVPLELSAAVERWRAGAVNFDATHTTWNESEAEGKRIVVTGGASGIGEACARSFARRGAHVVVADADHDAGHRLQNELVGKGESVKFFPFDAVSWDSQVRMFRQALQAFPGNELDVLITCAGVKPSADWDMTPTGERLLLGEEIGAMPPCPSTSCIDVNMIGTMYSAQLAIKYCMGLSSSDESPPTANAAKSLLLVGSMAGFRFLPNKPDYTAAKYGIRGLHKCLRHEASKWGLRVNLLAPYFIATPMTAPALNLYKSMGIKLGSMDDAVHAMLRMTLDSEMSGRAVCVNADGLIDMADDMAGDEGARAMMRMYESGSMKPYS